MRFARFVADTEMRFGALTDDVVREFPAYRGHRDCFQRFVRDARQRGKTLGSNLVNRSSTPMAKNIPRPVSPRRRRVQTCSGPPASVRAGASLGRGIHLCSAGWLEQVCRRTVPNGRFSSSKVRVATLSARTTSSASEPIRTIRSPSPSSRSSWTKKGKFSPTRLPTMSRRWTSPIDGPLYVSYSNVSAQSGARPSGGDGIESSRSGSAGDAAHRQPERHGGRRGQVEYVASAAFVRTLDPLHPGAQQPVAGTVLCTGGGIWPPFDFTLKPDDRVTIEITGLGRL